MELTVYNSKIVIVFIGLPISGKGFISKKIERYLSWMGYNVKEFNASSYKKSKENNNLYVNCDCNILNGHEHSIKINLKDCLSDLINFMKKDGDVGLLDGCFYNIEIRKKIKEELEYEIPELNIIWLETSCHFEDLMEFSIRQARIKSSDHNDILEESKLREFFTEKIKRSIVPIESISKSEFITLSYIKIYSIGKNLETYNITGFLQSKIMCYLMNLQMNFKPIYFTRHGESLFNLEDRIGGDSDLSEGGIKYAHLLNKFFQEEKNSNYFTLSQEKPKLMTSTLKRATHTTQFIDIGVNAISTKLLDEIDAGIYDGLSYEEIKERFPLEYFARDTDKLRYRYPRGESYLDLIQRIEPIIFEIERSKSPVILIGHQATLRCIYAYFAKNYEMKDVPYISIPHCTIIKLTPDVYFCKEQRYLININNGKIKVDDIEKSPLIPH